MATPPTLPVKQQIEDPIFGLLEVGEAAPGWATKTDKDRAEAQAMADIEREEAWTKAESEAEAEYDDGGGQFPTMSPDDDDDGDHEPRVLDIELDPERVTAQMEREEADALPPDPEEDESDVRPTTRVRDRTRTIDKRRLGAYGRGQIETPMLSLDPNAFAKPQVEYGNRISISDQMVRRLKAESKMAERQFGGFMASRVMPELLGLHKGAEMAAALLETAMPGTNSSIDQEAVTEMAHLTAAVLKLEHVSLALAQAQALSPEVLAHLIKHLGERLLGLAVVESRKTSPLDTAKIFGLSRNLGAAVGHVEPSIPRTPRSGPPNQTTAHGTVRRRSGRQ